MKLVRKKSIQGLFWAKEGIDAIKIGPTSSDAGSCLTHQLMDPLCK
jgi:hypothetical protein